MHEALLTYECQDITCWDSPGLCTTAFFSFGIWITEMLHAGMVFFVGLCWQWGRACGQVCLAVENKATNG